MGYKAKNKQKAPEPLEKPKFDGPSRRAKARMNKAKKEKEVPAKKGGKRQLEETSSKKVTKKPKVESAEDLWDDLEVASDDNSDDAEVDEFEMTDFESNDEQEEEEEPVEQDIYPQAEDDFLGSDSEPEVEEDEDEDEEMDDDEYDSDEFAAEVRRQDSWKS
jgi:hypothetical protein